MDRTTKKLLSALKIGDAFDVFDGERQTAKAYILSENVVTVYRVESDTRSSLNFDRFRELVGAKGRVLRRREGEGSR